MKIIADTATLIAPCQGSDYGITVIPVSVAINNRTYRDYAEISSADFLNLIKEGGIFSSSQPAIGAVSAAIGHCYPIFVHFRGGKAVAALYGFLFALWCFADYSPAVFFLPLITFWMILAAFRIVSLSSILSSIAGLIYVWCTKAHISAICATVFFVILIVYRHKGNIRRMIHGTERKITWMK